MLRVGRRRHVVLSVDQLVPLPVVGEQQEVVVGELQLIAAGHALIVPPFENRSMQLKPEAAQRAIYLDFECLATKPPHAALLGVLGPDDEFEQLILDPRLAPGRVASRHCRVVEAHTAIEQLVRRAEKEDRLLVGWSFFDRDVAARIAPDLDGLIRARYTQRDPDRASLATGDLSVSADHPGR